MNIISGKSNSIRHEAYLSALQNTKIPLVIATGPAGTGKTKFPCSVGIDLIADRQYERLIVTRPTVPVGDEEIGFLPGDVNDKLYPWMSHMMEYIDMYNLKYVQSKIDMVSLSYIRGETWHDRWVIADEMQNSTPLQMKTLLTRVGENTKLVITGDLSQCDRSSNENGLQDLINRLGLLENEDIMTHIEFTTDDVRRSDFVRYMLELYQ